MTGTVFDIQHFCTHDGPGIRTTVFLKGCSLGCAWCHNPESQDPRPEILFNETLCIGCGLCGELCPEGSPHTILRDASLRSKYCADCLKCQPACPSGALELAGNSISVGEVIGEVLKDKIYYLNSGGGLTVSGGEPLYQPRFLLELLEAAKAEGLHTVVETSGNGCGTDYSAILPYTDLFLWDVKLMDPALYREYTGGVLDTMLSNLEFVLKSGADVILRILFIPEIHRRREVIDALCTFVADHPSVPFEVIPYHSLGNSKRQKLGLGEMIFREPGIEEIEDFRAELSRCRSI